MEFRELYDANVDFVWRNLRRLGVADADADDRTQEVFVIAHRRMADFVDYGHGPRAWLYQIALRVASDFRRHCRRHPVDCDGGLSLEHERVDADQTSRLAQKEAMSRLDAALATLDEDKRAVLVLHEVEEMTAPEIADATGVPLNTVYSRLRLGRQRLEEALRRNERVSGEYPVPFARPAVGGVR
jgi:RNA polymerase sigma-70 factor (ECF subfamily)